MHDLETKLSDYWDHLIGQSQPVDVDAVISRPSSVVTEDAVMTYPLGADAKTGVLRGDELTVDYLQQRPDESTDTAATTGVPLVTPIPLRGPWITRRRVALAAVVVVFASVGLGLLRERGSNTPFRRESGFSTSAAEADTTTGPLVDGSVPRVVVSPLVEVLPTIVDQGPLEIFSVEVDPADGDYWRLMSLDEFDGELWRASSTFERADTEVPSNLDPSVPTRSVTQTITTTRLGNIYVPHAYELSEVIDSGGIGLEYESESGALVVIRDFYVDSLDGFSYTIESAVPIIDARRLRGASTDSLSSDFLDHQTKLPDLPETIEADAERITADATTDYDRALALQNHFRDNFTYNLDIALEHNSTDIDAFLFELREGHSEQFASAYAVMARSIGLPARVAVGFTWGDWSPSRGQYIVRGGHSHAWPEIYFAGTGWVRFEPTPTRGSPSDQAVTGVDPGQVNNRAGTSFDPGLSKAELDLIAARFHERIATFNAMLTAYNDGHQDEWLAFFNDDIDLEHASGLTVENEQAFMAANGRWTLEGDCGSIRGLLLSCPTSRRDDFYGAGGIDRRMPFVFIFDPNDTAQLAGYATGGDTTYKEHIRDWFDDHADFARDFLTWLQAAHPDTAADFKSDTLITAEDMPIALDYVDEFVTQSDTYPLS